MLEFLIATGLALIIGTVMTVIFVVGLVSYFVATKMIDSHFESRRDVLS